MSWKVVNLFRLKDRNIKSFSVSWSNFLKYKSVYNEGNFEQTCVDWWEIYIRSVFKTTWICVWWMQIFTKTNQMIEKFKDTSHRRNLCRNMLDNDISWDNVLKDNSFKIASNQSLDGYRRGLTLMIYNFWQKRWKEKKNKCKK